MEPPNHPPSFPNVVMGSYWGGFPFLDPLGGLGVGLWQPALAFVLNGAIADQLCSFPTTKSFLLRSPRVQSCCELGGCQNVPEKGPLLGLLVLYGG